MAIVAAKTELLVLFFKTRQEWETWLEQNHGTAPGLWIQFARKDSGKQSLTYPEAVEVALCYGWIDGQAARLDDAHWRQRFTPRRARSKWSEINCKKAEDLIAKGRMKPAGLKEVEAAKKDGRWAQAYKSQRNMTVPEDFQKELKKSRLTAAFGALDNRNRYAMLYRIHDAKKPETRARRIQQFVEMLKTGKKLY